MVRKEDIIGFIVILAFLFGIFAEFIFEKILRFKTPPETIYTIVLLVIFVSFVSFWIELRKITV